MKYFLYWICGQFSLALLTSFSIRTSDVDWSIIPVSNVTNLQWSNHLLRGAACPVNVERSMEGFFYVRPVEVNGCTLRGVHEPGWEPKNVPEIFCQPTKTSRSLVIILARAAGTFRISHICRSMDSSAGQRCLSHRRRRSQHRPSC